LQRVGGSETITFDARVISATNRSIVQEIRDGKFREDLYYRLFHFPIPLPPLRERGQDLLLLANHFLREYIKAHPEFKGKRLSAQARRAILDYAWPGNVRELKSAVERAVLLSDAEDIEPPDLLLNDQGVISPWSERVTAVDGAGAGRAPVQPVSFSRSTQQTHDGAGEAGIDLGGGDEIVALDDLKRRAVERAYRLCEGNVDRAAVELGIGRATMYRLLKKYNMMG